MSASGLDKPLVARWRALKMAMLDPQLSPAVRVIFMIVLDHMNNKSGWAWPSLATIAHEAGMDRSTVVRGIAMLVERGYLWRQSGDRKSSNRYRLGALSRCDATPTVGVASHGGRCEPAQDVGVASHHELAVEKNLPNEPSRLKEEVAHTRNDDQHALDVPTDLEFDLALVSDFQQHCQERGKPLTKPGWSAVVHQLRGLHAAGVDLNESLRVTMIQGYVIPVDPTRGKAAKIGRRQREQRRRVDADVRVAERTMPPSRPDREGAWTP